MSVIPTPGKAPCNFAVQYASPALALRLLESPRYRERPFYDFSLGELRERSKRATPFSLWFFCDDWVNFQGPEDKFQDNAPGSPHIQSKNESIYFEKERARESCRQGRIQNRDVARLLRSEASMAILNRLVETSMQENARSIEVALKKRLPACSIRAGPAA